ncbi:hypothetical protein KJ765_04745 [Candidatus Micrarchaeota archaeon]|nr:hypothetical protein [Candidatus Micrarchaeota archaeon]
MTVKGDELVHNCRNCFSQHGYGINLQKNGEGFECPHCHSHYLCEHGYMKRVN